MTVLKALLISLFAWSVASASEEKPVGFPDRAEVFGTETKLHGVGTRKATLFGIKVYNAAFYATKNLSTLDEVLSDAAPKRIEVEYLRDFGLDDTNEAWSYQFKESAGVDLGDIKSELNQLISYQKKINKHDTQRFDIGADQVVFSINGEKRGAIIGKTFKNALLTLFFGPNPPTKELQRGLFRGLLPSLETNVR